MFRSSRTRRSFRRPGVPGVLAVACAAGLAAGCSDSPTGTGGKPNPDTSTKVGDVVSLNVQTNTACSNPVFRGGRVVAVSNRAIVVADTSNPAGGFTTAEYASIATAFDTLVYPVDTRNFGVPTDLDRNGRVIIFYTRAVNELTSRGSDSYVGGFFWNRDIFPKTSTNPNSACAGSNDGEVFYMLVPDPQGTINGNARSKAFVQGGTVAVVAHEFQHLISATRRLYTVRADNYDESVYLNEGLSHIAEELTFYRSAGLSPAGQPGQSPRADLTITALRQSQTQFDALTSYNIQNLGRLSRYFKSVDDSTALGLSADDDGLSTRGGIWAFLRYAADRSTGTDSSFFYRLVNSADTGVANLRAVTGAGSTAALADLFRDWAVANYADNYAAPALDERFTYKSWNFRSLLPALTSNGGAYPLVTHPLTSGVAQTVTTVGGTASYFPFSVRGGATATVRTRDAGGGAPGSAVRITLVRVTTADAAGGPAVTTYDAGAGADLTVANPAAGSAQYALVVFNASLDNPLARQTVTVTGTDLDTPPVAARLAVAGPTVARLLAESAAGPTVTDAGLHARLQAIGRRELAGRVAGARAEYRARLQRQ